MNSAGILNKPLCSRGYAGQPGTKLTLRITIMHACVHSFTATNTAPSRTKPNRDLVPICVRSVAALASSTGGAAGIQPETVRPIEGVVARNQPAATPESAAGMTGSTGSTGSLAGVTSVTSTPSGAPSLTNYGWELAKISIVLCLLVIALYAVSLVLTGKLRRKSGAAHLSGEGTGGKLEVIASRRLDQHNTLYIVRANTYELVISANAAGVTPLVQLSGTSATTGSGLGRVIAGPGGAAPTVGLSGNGVSGAPGGGGPGFTVPAGPARSDYAGSGHREPAIDYPMEEKLGSQPGGQPGGASGGGRRNAELI